MTHYFENAREAGRQLALIPAQKINEVLLAIADRILTDTDQLLQANQQDLDRMDPTDPKYDRLKLTAERLAGIASDMRHVAGLPSPLGRVLKEDTLPNGLQIKRVSVPFGVIGIIYEARPNVSFDVSALCLKAGSACVLKGGSDARCSNEAIVALIHQVLERQGIPQAAVTLLPSTREATEALLHARDQVDLIIPRGSSRLIQYVRQEATVPVIETGAGVVHAYFDQDGDLEMGKRIIQNAKTRRVSVCNALDCLLVHSSRLADLPALLEPMQGIVTFYDGKDGNQDIYGHEWLDYKLSIKVVESLDEALSHIRTYGSGHSECIITNNEQTAQRFLNEVDAACVYVNAPTSFTDGAQFGLGAEIGISTQKLHARGPMALEEICTYKWMIRGNGQTRK